MRLVEQHSDLSTNRTVCISWLPLDTLKAMTLSLNMDLSFAQAFKWTTGFVLPQKEGNCHVLSVNNFHEWALLPQISTLCKHSSLLKEKKKVFRFYKPEKRL